MATAGRGARRTRSGAAWIEHPIDEHLRRMQPLLATCVPVRRRATVIPRSFAPCFATARFWLTHLGRLSPALTVHGAAVHGNRPLPPGDVIQQLDIDLVFELA